MPIFADPKKDIWNKFIVENSSPSSFLQSWEWGDFQQALGNKVYRLALVGESGAYDAVAQAIVRPLYLNKTYLEIAKGPVMKTGDDKHLGSMLEELKKIARRENSILIRINPPYESSLQPATYNLTTPEILLRQMEPADTLLVDLSKSEDDLLTNMHEKSRYNIRLALKKGVTVEDKTGDRGAFDQFLKLIEETSKRDGIIVWPRERFEKFREHFLADEKGDGARAILLAGKFEGKTLATAIIMLFGDTGTYLYAASSAEQRNANVPSLVLWEAIRKTKAASKKYYDMWGIAPDNAGESHSWSGITRFKSRYTSIGKTGVEKHYAGSRDMVLDKKYYQLFKFGKRLRGILPK